MGTKITAVDVHDVRFPTAATADGSDAINRGDYSATYVELRTDAGPTGAGLTFTNGRGNEITCAAVRALDDHVVGRTIEEIFDEPVAFWRSLTADPQLRWIGPEKGVIHMATGAVVNAVWDLRAKLAGVPMWRLLAQMPADELVQCVDFHHISDALTPQEAHAILQEGSVGWGERLAALEQSGFPSYTTSVGWLGYSDEKIRALTQRAYAEGWRAMKMKVGGPIDDDVRRAHIIREEIGPDALLMMDANQVWDVDEAIAKMQRLASVQPVLDRRAHTRGRRARPCPYRPCGGADPCGHRRGGRQPGHLQAASTGRGDPGLPGGRLPGRGRQRGGLDPPDGREVRGTRLPARRRCGALRVRATPGDVRLPAGRHEAGWSDGRVRRSSARALRRPGARGRRPVSGADRARLQRHDETVLDRRVLVPGRPGMAVTAGPGVATGLAREASGNPRRIGTVGRGSDRALLT